MEEGMQIKTEEEKLRDKIHLMDWQLKKWLSYRGIPFDCDGVGCPWLSNAMLRWVIAEMEIAV